MNLKTTAALVAAALALSACSDDDLKRGMALLTGEMDSLQDREAAIRQDFAALQTKGTATEGELNALRQKYADLALRFESVGATPPPPLPSIDVTVIVNPAPVVVSVEQAVTMQPAVAPEPVPVAPPPVIVAPEPPSSEQPSQEVVPVVEVPAPVEQPSSEPVVPEPSSEEPVIVAELSSEEPSVEPTPEPEPAPPEPSSEPPAPEPSSEPPVEPAPEPEPPAPTGPSITVPGTPEVAPKTYTYPYTGPDPCPGSVFRVLTCDDNGQDWHWLSDTMEWLT